MIFTSKEMILDNKVTSLLEKNKIIISQYFNNTLGCTILGIPFDVTESTITTLSFRIMEQ